ncbi:MAG: DUF4105 domain-containing protein [SAR324 cluster bacterium]|nr:DUF4105 domain-containing protein [SAR324 cluster bacterium]
MSIFQFKRQFCWVIFLLLMFMQGTHAVGKTRISEPASSNETAIFLSLWKQARERKLSHHPYWLKLLHFYSIGESVGQWSFKSDIVSPSFFLSPLGKTNPAEELKSTLIALLGPVSDKPDQHARCKFIARFQWLRSQLDFPELTELTCPLFERWANLKEATGISIVFVSSFLKNPASTFGHLLIKFNSSNRHFGHSLLRPTLNFGAIVNPDDNPFTYALRGIFGGYEGRFTDERFYNFNHVYGENELRDLWEYPLHFNREQQYRITFHAWELLQNVQFKYYFFLDNCAYRMAELLEMAWTDSTRINTSGALWAIPVDVVFKLNKISSDSNQLSLLGKPRLIPSRQRKLQTRATQLSELEHVHLKKLIKYENYIDSNDFRNLTERSQAQIIDVLLDHQQYQKTIEPDLKQSPERSKLLRVRSKLPILENEFPFENTKSPTEGTPPMRFRLGAVFNDFLGHALETGVWANYHDLLGEESGHLLNAEVVTLDLHIQFRDDSFELTQFQLFNIQKYALNPTGISGDFDWSWRTRAGWERENLGCSPCRKFLISGGMGGAISLAGKDVEHAFVELYGETDKESKSAISLGYAPHLGVNWSPMEMWKIRLERGWFQSLQGPKKVYQNTRFDQRMTISQNWDIRLEVQQLEYIEGILALHFYW